MWTDSKYNDEHRICSLYFYYYAQFEGFTTTFKKNDYIQCTHYQSLMFRALWPYIELKKNDLKFLKISFSYKNKEVFDGYGNGNNSLVSFELFKVVFADLYNYYVY